MWKNTKCVWVAVSFCLIVTFGVFGRERARTRSPFLRIYDSHAGFVAGRMDRIPATTTSGSHLLIDDGGNILSNGKGVVLTTTTLLQENQPDGFDETLLRESLRTYLGCEHLVMLEPLSGERTGHVDMFATFTDSRTVVVASCDPDADPVNASILDQNAACLAAVPAPYGPLRVVRIPMPERKDGLWRTYNNVIFANGLLLVPTYFGVAPDVERVAMQRYREVLPTWDVMGIDASGIIELDGALHCISMNVPAEASR